jgi:hypothetical protein
MAQDLKHVGRFKDNGRKCLVAFRTIPGDAFNCLVVPTEGLDPSQHDAIITLVESNAAQTAFEFGEVLARSVFPDGSTMLPSLHARGLLAKIPTDRIEMLPNFQTTVLLSELNQMIAEQQGVSVQDLAVKPDKKSNLQVQEVAQVKDISPANNTTEPVVDQKKETVDASLTPEEKAKEYRSLADKLSKEAAQYRRLAEDLAPTKKKVASVS